MIEDSDRNQGRTEASGTTGRLVLSSWLTARASEEEERFRVLGTRVRHLTGSDAPSARVIGVTSSLPGEGKSYCCINLAATLARDFQLKVLLIEADLRLPSITDVPPGAVGLTTALEQKRPLCEVALLTDIDRLHVIVAGAPVGDAAARYLGGPTLQRELLKLREMYDFIVVDCPPILPVADVELISDWLDHLLMIIRAGETEQSVVQNALAEVGPAKLLGVVLNGSEEVGDGYGYRYRYP